MMRRSLMVSVAVAVLTSGSRVYASPVYPGVVAEVLALGKAPECTLCHTTPSGGSGTANQPLATYLRSRGLTGGAKVDLLRTALAAMKAERHDSNGDGMTDEEALTRGLDPNGQVESDVPPPSYGCAAKIAPVSSRGTMTASLCALIALVALTLGRRRTRG